MLECSLHNEKIIMFADLVKIYIKAGDGGNGRLSFLHEKYREFGGPDGGDGGFGGDVIFRVNPSWNTLYFYKTHRKLLAENGENGKERRKHGRNGKDLIIDVPIGTTIYDEKTNELVADLDINNKEFLIAEGGDGGFGNAHFISSTRQKPQFAELGTRGEEYDLRLELKLIADVGLVGLPNIGKSTFLSVVSSAKPKIADYPFTTVTPNLGVVEKYGTSGFVIADIPGLIEGASHGKGLGDEFLRHIERTRVIVHFLDALSDNLEEDFKLINQELAEYNKDILQKPQVLAISRADLLNKKEKNEVIKIAEKIIKNNKKVFKYGQKPFIFSAVTHEGVKELVFEIERELEKIPKEVETEKIKTFTMADVKRNIYDVEKIGKKYRVTGRKIEHFAQKTDFSNRHAVMRLYDIMKRTGVLKQAEKKGARFGDKIQILDQEIEYKE